MESKESVSTVIISQFNIFDGFWPYVLAYLNKTSWEMNFKNKSVFSISGISTKIL